MRASGLLALGAVVCAAAPVALGQFSSDPAAQLQVGSGAGNQSKVRPLSGGGYYVAWQGAQGAGGNTWVQKLDQTGNPLWAAGGVQVTDAQYTGSFEDFGFDVDSHGNVLIAHRDNSSGTVVISLQKVLPDGTRAWGPNGITIPGGPAGSTDSPHSPRVTCLSDGGYAVAFSRGTTTATATSRACYQKVSENGALLWNGGQAIVLTPATNGYIAADMVEGDNGSVVAAYYTIGSFTVSRRVLAQKFDGATGAPLWNGGSPVVVQQTSTLQAGNWPQVVTDHAGGMLVSWYETANPLQCYVQHVRADGTVAFPAGGSAATNGAVAGQQRTSPWVAYDLSTQTTYMTFRETNTSQGAAGLGVQAFGPAGERLWGDAGHIIVPIGATSHQVDFTRATLTPGGFIATWFESSDAGVHAEVRASKIDAETGFPSWQSPIVTVNSSFASKARLDVYAPPQGPTVAVYGDNPGTLNIDASLINYDGSIGNLPSCGPADFNGDGDVGTDQDIEAFFACLGGNCCTMCWPRAGDFNGDGDVGTDQDIEAFFRVLGGGNC